MNQAVQEIVARYQQLTPAQRDHLTEEMTKTAFITPLFQALGWNIHDPNEMFMEESVSGGRVDYAFRLHGVTRFYVEAKRADTEIHDLEYARQTINYAFNKGVPWAVLTNFRQLVVFPAFAQVPQRGAPPRVLDLTWEDYAQPDSGLELLTREAVAEDRLRQRAERTGVRARAIELQKELYEAMRGWRETLINQIATAMQYSLEDLHQAEEAVQRLLNRLMFLRNCEDRDISENRLRAVYNQWRANPARVHLADRLSRLFAQAADTYDSELFTTDAVIDMLLPSLGTQVDRVLGDVLTGLYQPPNSWAEYNFKDIDSDVLGAMYEQYLGHVAQRSRTLAVERERQLSLRQTLRLGSGQAQDSALGIQTPAYQVEARLQRRKEQGIYYTPKWVVDYIVGQTLGRWLQEHGEDSEALERLAVLDPACGSGSFLIRAYETLLEHEAIRTNQTVEMLSREEREHILRRNIHGVDLDNQAVEIARLNLLLRMVREEEKLPELKENVLRGNSLISGGAAELEPWFGDAWKEKHPLTWDVTFREVMERGGFDVVIGNPPYVRIQSLPEQDRDYYRAHYSSAHGSFDIYVLFIVRALSLLREGGRLGFITSGKFLKAEYGKKLIQHLQEHATVEEIVDLSARQVFGEATTYPVILVVRKGARQQPLVYTQIPADAEVATASQVAGLREERAVRAGQSALGEGVWPLPNAERKAVLEKMRQSGQPLLELATNIFQGLVTGLDAIFTVHLRELRQDGTARVWSMALAREVGIERQLLRVVIQGAGVSRYNVRTSDSLLLFPYKEVDGNGQLIELGTIIARFPLAAEYLEANKERLESREAGRFRGEAWYGYSRPQNLTLHDKPKLIIPRLVYDLEVAYDPDGEYYLDNVDVGGVILKDDSERSYLYVLGVLNSKAADFFFRSISVPFRGEYRSANRQFIAPIPVPDVPDAQRSYQDVLVAHVSRMLELRRRLGEKGAAHDAEREALEREIRETDRAIDELVYELYGLTAAERRLVEEEVGERSRMG